MPEFPSEAGYIWEWFSRIYPDTDYKSIESFFSLRKISPKPWEVDAIISLAKTAHALD